MERGLESTNQEGAHGYIIDRWWILAAQELLAEVLNRSGFDTDEDGGVLPIAEDFNLSSHLSYLPTIDQ
jgi:hypothetical protein